MESSSIPVCVSMPSATAARDFVAGTPGSLAHLAVSYAGRTAVVAAGMALAGKRRHVFRDAAAGTAIIEAILLAYFAARPRPDAVIPTQHHVSELLRGKPGAWLPVSEDIAIRALELGAGMYLVGTRKKIVKDAIAGSLAVQALIALYAIYYGKPCPL